MSFPLTFNEETLPSICDQLSKRDKDLAEIVTAFGYPPFWQRNPSFETLVYIILEQQVSLASAKAAFLKLKEILPTVTPEEFLSLDESTLKSCYFSRQKISYTRHLAASIITSDLQLELFVQMTNDEIRACLTRVKGIGNWTVDVYLMMALHRTNLFPLGDVALVRSLKDTKTLKTDVSKEELALVVLEWEPYQTIAAYLLWHAYLTRKKNRASNTGPIFSTF